MVGNFEVSLLNIFSNWGVVSINTKHITSCNSLFNLFILKEKSPDSFQMTRTLPPIEGTSVPPVCFSPSPLPFYMSASNWPGRMVLEKEDPVQPAEPGNS